MKVYPSKFPCAMIQGYSYTVGMGVIRSEGSMVFEQRRVHDTMPHMISASFMLSTELWGLWEAWMREHGRNWFEMPEMPTMYFGKNQPLIIRLWADTLKIKARTDKYYKIDARFEVSPTMYRLALEAP